MRKTVFLILSLTFLLGLFSVLQAQGASLLWTEDFGATAPAGWTVLTPSGFNSWSLTGSGYPYSGSHHMTYMNTGSVANTWAFTPGISMTAGNDYYLTFYQRVRFAYGENLKVTVGNAQTVASQTTTLLTLTNLNNTAYTQRTTAHFSPTISGTYHFAIHCYSPQNKDFLFVDYVQAWEINNSSGPADPDNFSASAVSESQINLSWDLNNDADNVLLAWNTVNTFGTPSGSYSAGGTITGGGTVLLADSPNTGFNHTGLTASNTYYYKIWSLDANGDYSNGVTANTTTTAGPVIENPEDFSAGAVSDEQIDLSWDLNDDDEPILLAWNSSNDFGTPSGSYTAGDPISGGGTVLLANSSNISFNHTGLNANTQYFYKIWSLHEESNIISYSSGVTANASTFDVIIKTFPWMEGFEANSPTRGSWTQIHESFTQNWVWATGADTGTIRTAHSGNLNARFSANYPGYRTKLVTPILDLSSLDHPVLSFWYGQEEDTPRQNSLTIFYRSNPSDPWTQLGDPYTDNVPQWTLVDGISLPNPSASYQLAFEGYEQAGHANVLDDVEIREDEEHVPVELSSFTAAISADNFVNLSWVTQSETGVLGFYVLRNGSAELSSAMTVSELIPATNTSEQQSYIFKDTELFEDGHYFYWLQNSDMDGSVQFHGPVSIQFTAAQGDIPELPLATELKPVYPNPFNPMAFIPFSLKENATVNFEIYNARGQLVKRIPLGQKAAGNHRIEWDGRDDRGINCTTGVYHIRMTAGNESFSRKAVLMK